MLKEVRRVWLWSMVVILALSAYPLVMGLRVLGDLLQYGKVLSENYPKYVIPYTPVSLGVIAAGAVMPWMLRRVRRPVVAASILAIAVFLMAEIALENVLVGGGYKMEAWQMFLCILPYEPPESAAQAVWSLRMPPLETEVGQLIGAYRPSVKLHFYMISAVLVLSAVNSCYGFGRIAHTGDRSRLRWLMAQTVAAMAFLTLCVLACFTAFFRDGSLQVSPLSAGLMAVFFILLGLTAGLLTGNAFARRAPLIAGTTASAVTLLMYLGEMALLRGQLYRFGTGFLFDGIGGMGLAPADVLIVLLSGVICAGICQLMERKVA